MNVLFYVLHLNPVQWQLVTHTNVCPSSVDTDLIVSVRSLSCGQASESGAAFGAHDLHVTAPCSSLPPNKNEKLLLVLLSVSKKFPTSYLQ